MRSPLLAMPTTRPSSLVRGSAVGYVSKEWNRELLLERLALGEDSRVEFEEASFKGERIVRFLEMIGHAGLLEYQTVGTGDDDSHENGAAVERGSV